MPRIVTPMPLRAVILGLVLGTAGPAAFAQAVGDHAGPQRLQIGATTEQRLSDATATVDLLRDVLTERPRRELCEAAQAVVVFPEVVKTDVGAQGHRGPGVMVRRTWKGQWSDAVFVELSQGAFEPPEGPDPTTVVLVFGREIDLDAMLEDEVDVSVDAPATSLPSARRIDTEVTLTGASDVRVVVIDDGQVRRAALATALLTPHADANHEVYGAMAPLGAITSGRSDAPPVVQTFVDAVAALCGGEPGPDR